MTDTPAAPEKLDRYDALILAGFALVKIAVHLCTVLPYGMFRDEFYYLDCANHLDWAYVDQPSLSIFLLAAMRAVFGDGLLAVRLPVILAGAGTVVMAGLIAREMGCNRFARFLACLLALISPIVLAMSSFYSMNAFDLLFWAVGAWLLARIFRTGDGRLWPWFGLVAGFGIENKWSMGFFGAALVVALALTEHRKFFRDPRLWIGGAIALALFVPNLVWQATHQFATFEFMRNAAMGKNAANTPWSYAAGQLLLMHPLNAILAVAGLFYGFFGRAARPWRAFSIIYAVLFCFFVVSHGKTYYIAPMFSILFALGACWFARMTESHPRWRLPVVAVLVVAGAVTLPCAVPMLPVNLFVKYQAALGIEPPREERAHYGVLPQHFGDRFGWREMTKLVANTYNALPPEDRAKCAILTGNYGEAGALNYYGRSYGLPKAISMHNAYYLWGPGDATGEVMLVYGGPAMAERLKTVFNEVTEVAHFDHPYAMAYEKNMLIYRCRGLKMPVKDLWPLVKSYG